MAIQMAIQISLIKSSRAGLDCQTRSQCELHMFESDAPYSAILLRILQLSLGEFESLLHLNAFECIRKMKSSVCPFAAVAFREIGETSNYESCGR